MVWGVQNEIHYNRFNNIRYSDLFILNFNDSTSYSFGYYLRTTARDMSSGSGSGGYSGGGFGFGGGATGGW